VSIVAFAGNIGGADNMPYGAVIELEVGRDVVEVSFGGLKELFG